MNNTKNPEGSITKVLGIEVGHFTDARRPTGCSVIIARDGAVAGVDGRGAAADTGGRQHHHRRDRHRCAIDQAPGPAAGPGAWSIAHRWRSRRWWCWRPPVSAAAPHRSTPATAPSRAMMTLQPVGRRASVKCPTSMPRTLVMLPSGFLVLFMVAVALGRLNAPESSTGSLCCVRFAGG